jgi:para-nitrobenzyl esterase
MNETPDAPVVRTSSGLVRGETVDGVCRFYSIPYAAHPVGDLRFSAPEPHPAWEGVRDALTPGSSAPQPLQAARSLGGLDLSPLFAAPWEPDREFLTANVWTPDPNAGGLPVMVFIHGGAFLVGGKDAPLYDGAAFARSGVVLVSINYRMGLEGFVHIPGADTNLGLRDPIAALAWVRANAGAFGGDPGNVTVFGESAGAMITADLVASPLAEGLFQRAIVQSGHGAMVRRPETALKLTRLLARRLKVSPDVAGFASRDIAAGLKAVEWSARPTTRLNLREAHGRDPTVGLSKYLPVFGDEVLPEPPMEALRHGAGAKVDLLIGANREEMNFYFVPTGVRKKIGSWLARFMLGRVQPQAGRILRDYGLGQKGRRPGEALAAAMTDLAFRWPARRYAAEHQGRTHVYDFGWRSPACGGELGACHGLELAFVFNTLAAATGPDGLVGSNPPQVLADRIQKLWVDFARDGTAPWPEYSRDDPQVLTLETGACAPEPPFPAAAYLP